MATSKELMVLFILSFTIAARQIAADATRAERESDAAGIFGLRGVPGRE
jgi:hypothetical protein